MLALDLFDNKSTNKIVELCMDDGLLLFFFLFNNSSIRITPPLTISKEEIKKFKSLFRMFKFDNLSFSYDNIQFLICGFQG